MPASFDRAFAIGIGLNLAFVLVEAWYGWQADSLALWADAAHNLGDVAGLVLAWVGVWAARLAANEHYTYGRQRVSLWAAAGNGVLLLVGMGSLGWEAAHRLIQGHGSVPQSVTVMIVATLGIVINGTTAWLFMRGRADDVNIQGAFWHMAGDALVSAGVVAAAGLTWWLGWTWLDPVLGIIIAVVIVWGSARLLWRSMHLLMDGVPHHIALPEVRAHLLALSGVSAVTDLHVWAMGSTHTALTAHLVVPQGSPGDGFLREAAQSLRQRFRIDHVTLQTVTEGNFSPCLRETANPDHRDQLGR